MRYSNLFGKTSKTIPTDLTAESHKLLYKGGFIRDISAGRYAYLPLGMSVRSKVIDLINEEMSKAGSQLVLTPTLHPIEFWTATNRDKAFGSEMLVVEDHHGATFAIGGTAEGMMVELVKKFSPSYRDLPIKIHQFSEKFRDEKRPRGGLLRVREFTMKDAYSFDVSEDAMMESYWAFYNAYIRIFEKLHLEAIPVEADSGAIGGDFNHEFIVPSEIGESMAYKSTDGSYMSHEDRATFVRKDINTADEMQPFEIFEQPEWVQTMEDNKKHYNLPAERFLKNVVYKDEHGRVVIAVMRGDLEANPAKIKKLLNIASLEDATDDDLQSINTKRGYVHSWGHDAVYVGDESLLTVRNFIGGQKEELTDSRNVNYGRDFTCEYFGDIAMAYDGAQVVGSDATLEKVKGIEVGHVFKFDHFYTDPMNGEFVDEQGERVNMYMGSYGIGIGRVMATLIETHHDEKGMMWPHTVAPYHIHMIAIGKDDHVTHEAEKLYVELQEKGYSVLFDDRENVRPGEKLADADLLGMPIRIIISQRSLEQEEVEVKLRSEEESYNIPVQNIFNEIDTLIGQ